jgi:hypothetical protein
MSAKPRARMNPDVAVEDSEEKRSSISDNITLLSDAQSHTGDLIDRLRNKIGPILEEDGILEDVELGNKVRSGLSSEISSAARRQVNFNKTLEYLIGNVDL